MGPLRPLSLLLLALLLSAAPSLPAAQAQGEALPSTAAPPLPVLQDEAGDVSLPPAGVVLPGQPLHSYDLRGLTMADDEESVTFTVAVDGLYGGIGDVPEGTGTVLVHFHHRGVEFRVRIDNFCPDSCWWATLQRWSEPAQSFIWVEGVEAQLDLAADTLAGTVAKAGLTDEAGAMPFQGRVLDHVWAESVYHPGDTGAVQPSVDRMPDQGEGTYPVRGGLPQSGGLALWSDQPVRGSNGEATTYVFTVQAENQGAAGTFHLSARGVPAGWDVRFPQPSPDVASGQTKPLPVLLTVPFAHQHGAQPSFLVDLAGDDPARHGQVRLGVLYTDPPQPAGHHSDLFVHTGAWAYNAAEAAGYSALHMPGRTWAWMNTLEEDPQDGAADVPAYVYQAQGSSSARYGWFPYLGGLTVGLDFDLSRPLQLTLPIATDAPLPGAQLTAHLYASWRTGDGGWENVRLATLVSDPLDLAAGETHLFQLEGLPTPDADRIAPHKDMYLQWSVYLDGQRPLAQAGGATPEAPVLKPGASMHLPLLEYHDAVDQVFASLDGVRLVADGPSSRMANPGETVLYNLTLENGGDAGRFHLALSGEHAPWARVLGPDSLDVQAGAQVPVAIAVRPPADAPDGQPLDLLVEAHGPGGSTALLRLSGEVVTNVDVPDEGGLAGGLDHGRPSPAPAAALLALGLLALAVIRRRD